ncbi:MAG: ribokinase [Gammaproteobacteria bacterium]|nr:ribokinase [Gammaproteobacteria bacterium]
MKSILVIGSSNTDMVIRVPELPAAGETVMGSNFRIFGGGKGANQAIAARRAGGEVRFLAALGDDDFGSTAIDTFQREGIQTDAIKVMSDKASGVALIYVSDAGENCIAVASGANACLRCDVLDESLVSDAQLLLVQLESPLETVARAIAVAKQAGVPAILNPAPAAPLPDDVLNDLYCITPNETEATALTGIVVHDLPSAAAAATRLREKGVRNVIITMGADGALLHNAESTTHCVANSVNVVDTTAAGDTFNGVLAALIAEGKSLQAAVPIAVAAATCSVQSAGAFDSIPFRAAYNSTS